MSKIKVPTNSVPGESSLSGLKIAAFSVSSMVGERESCGVVPGARHF